METLSCEYALSRTGITLFLIASVVAISTANPLGYLFSVTVGIYFLSFRKHAQKIVELMEDSAEIDTEHKEEST